MIGGSLARRYARALLAIGEEERQSRKILAEVERFGALMSGNALLLEAMEEKVSQRYGVNVLEIIRGKRRIAMDLRNTRIRA